MGKAPRLSSKNLPPPPICKEVKEGANNSTEKQTPAHDKLDVLEKQMAIDDEFNQANAFLEAMRKENDRYEQLVQRHEAANAETKRIMQNVTDTKIIVTSLKDSILLAIEGFSRKIIDASKLVIKATLIPEDAEKLRKHSAALAKSEENHMSIMSAKCKNHITEHYRQIRDLSWDNGNGFFFKGKMAVFVGYLSLGCIILVAVFFTLTIYVCATK